MYSIWVLHVCIDRTWNGELARADERVEMTIVEARAGMAPALRVDVDAPWHGDPAPQGPAGPTAQLWNYEVVELFLLGPREQYLEVEMGPHGHHLVLVLEGRRRPVRSGLALDYRVERIEARWKGSCVIPASMLPPGLCRYNAYAIHGRGEQRRHLAAFPHDDPSAPAPDFHRLESFGSLPEVLTRR